MKNGNILDKMRQQHMDGRVQEPRRVKYVEASDKNWGQYQKEKGQNSSRECKDMSPTAIYKC